MSTTLFYIVLFAFTTNLLSVSGLRCHQCNSHDNEDCVSLMVRTPRAQRDDQYLRDCAQQGDQQVFCRKTIVKLEALNEQRIDRSCGWIREIAHNTCFTADNEGYKQTICTCSEDGCNGASALTGVGPGLAITLGLTVTLSYLQRH
ncbi:hypothetical protein ACLKA7_003959 [Drosophila subpalustris]